MTEENQNQENPENLPVPAKKAQVPIVDGKFAPTDFDGLWRIAHVMASTNMVPDRYQGKTQDAFVALAMGMEIGLSHMGALQNIAVVKGTPTVFADGVTGLIQGSGQLEWMKEGFKDGDQEVDPSDLPTELKEWPDTLKAYCHMKRKGQEEVYKGSFSVADAKRMGKWMYKSNSVWSVHPARMLTWRARTWPCRDGFSDILKGLKIYEEVVDYEADMQSTNGQYEIVEPSVVTELKQEIRPEHDGVVEDTPQVHEDKTIFETMCEDNKINHDLAMEYIKEIAEITGAPIITISAKAVNNKVEFISKFQEWAKSQSEEIKEKDQATQTGTETPSDEKDCQNCDVPGCPGCEIKEMGEGLIHPEPEDQGAAEPDAEGNSVDDPKNGQADDATPVPQKKAIEIEKDIITSTIKKWGGLRGVDFAKYVKANPEEFTGIPAEEYAKAVKKWNSLVYARTKEEWPLKGTENQPEIKFPKQSMKQHLGELKKDYPDQFEKSIKFRGFAKSGLGEEASQIVVQDVIDLMGGKALTK